MKKAEWRKRIHGTPRQKGQSFILERSTRTLPRVLLKQMTKSRSSSSSQSYPSRRVKFSMKNVPTSRISFSEKNPEKLDERAQHFMDMYHSGKTIPPILVHRLPSGKYEVIDGHARLEAYRRMGITEIPAVENSVMDIVKKIGRGTQRVAGVVATGALKGAEVAGRARETAKEFKEAYESAREESELKRSARKLSRIHKLAKSTDPYVRRMAIAKLRKEYPEELRELQEGKN